MRLRRRIKLWKERKARGMGEARNRSRTRVKADRIYIYIYSRDECDWDFFDSSIFPPPTAYEILSVNGNRENILVEINLRMNNNRSILPLLDRFVGYFFE